VVVKGMRIVGENIEFAAMVRGKSDNNFFTQVQIKYCNDIQMLTSVRVWLLNSWHTVASESCVTSLAALRSHWIQLHSK
jgi:hypothetical protein